MTWSSPDNFPPPASQQLPAPPPPSRIGRRVLQVIGVLAIVGFVAILYFNRNVNVNPQRDESGETEDERNAREAREAFATTSPAATQQSDDSQVPEGDRMVIALTLDRLGDEFKSGDPERITEYFDLARTFDVLQDGGAFGGRRVRRSDAASKMKKMLIEQGFPPPARIGVRRRLVFFKRFDKDDVLVYMRSWNADGRQARSRWWLSRTRSEWFVYDAEDLDGGMRWTSQMTFGIQGEQNENLALGRAIEAAAEAIQAGDADGALKALAPFRGKRVPAELNYAQHMVRAFAQILKHDYAAAYVELDWAAEIKPDVPMIDLLKSRISFESGDYAATIAFADHAIATLGADAEALHFKAAALHLLNRRDEALAVYRAALDDDPDSQPALVDFTACLPEGRRDEAAERFARSSMTPALLNAVAAQLASPADAGTLAAVQNAYRKAHPDDATTAATKPVP